MRSTRPRARWLCIAPAAVVMIVAMSDRSGDRSDDAARGGAPGPDTLATALDATRAVASGRVELTTTVPGPGGPLALVHRAEFSGGGDRVRATSDLSQVAAALDAAGRQVEGDWTRPTGVMVEGDTVYAQLGPMADALGHDPDHWTQARLADVATSAAAADNDTLALALDPLGALDLLRRPVGEIGRVGRDEVRGSPVEHLRASLALAGGPEGDPAPGSFESRLLAAGLTSLPVDVWLDDGGRVRRLAVTVEQGVALTMTFDVYDLDAPVEVSAPDPAAVIDPTSGGTAPGEAAGDDAGPGRRGTGTGVTGNGAGA